MRKMWDALLGRGFRASKFKVLVNLAISRLAVLKNQKRTRCSNARSDVVQLLQMSEQERSLIRVEQVIKEQSMWDVFVMIEGYCILLSERVILIEQEKTCPDELHEAISSLIFAATRCGEIPELQEMRYVFTSRFGKEFTLRATELRNGCGVNPKIIQKLSTRRPSLESRIQVLKDIANENGISLQLEEAPSMVVLAEEKANKEEDNLNTIKNLSAGSGTNFGDKDVPEEKSRVEKLSLSLTTGRQYKNAAEAAQDAFLSAAYAAAAARAAVDLSRSSSRGPSDDSNDNQRKQIVNSNSKVKPRTISSKVKYAWESGEYVQRHDEVHPLDNYSFDSDYSAEIDQSDEMMVIKQIDPISISPRMASGIHGKSELQSLKLSESEDEESKKIYSIGNKDEWEEKGPKMLCYFPIETASDFQANSWKANEEQSSTGLAVDSSLRLTTAQRPYSLRTRR